MSVADNKQILRHWFEQVWNHRRREVVRELTTPATVMHGLSDDGKPVRGSDGFLLFFERFLAAFPDLRIVVEDVIGEGDIVAARVRAEAKHEGDSLGIAATGKPVNFTGMVWARLENGKIAEGWNEVDMVGMLKQVGAM